MSQNVSSENSAYINPSASTASSQASSQSVLFSLLALGLYAMTQPSILGPYSSGSYVLVPHRSSPFVCLLDSLVLIASGFCRARRLVLQRSQQRRADRQNEALRDTQDIEGAARRQGRSSPWMLQEDIQDNLEVQLSLPNPAALTLKVTMFLLGVLPQALKLFAIQGIPFTQVLAALFLSSSLISSAASIIGIKFSDPGLREVLNDLHDAKANASLSKSKRIRATAILVAMASTMLIPALSHIIVTIWAWCHIAAELQFTHEDLTRLLLWTNLLGLFCLILFTPFSLLIQWTRSWPKLPSLPRLIRMAWTCCLWSSVLIAFFRDPSASRSASLQQAMLLMRGCVLMLVVKHCCIKLSMAFSKLLYIVLRARGCYTSNNAKYMVEVISFIDPPLLLREIEYKIRHEVETDLNIAMATTRSQKEAVSKLLEHGRERVGLKLPSGWENLYSQSLVSDMERSHAKISRPGCQFRVTTARPHQDYESLQWKVSNAMIKECDMVGAGLKEPAALQTLKAMLSRTTVPYQQRWLWTSLGVEKASAEVEWIAFSLFNLLTAVVYYLYVFDGSATVNPSWTESLG